MSILDRILPVDEKPETLRRWRVCHSLVAWGGLLLALGIGTAAVTDLPLIGQMAWANDLDKRIDEKIKASVEPIAQAQRDQGAQITAALELLKNQEIAEAERAILIAKKEQCAAVREGRSAAYWTEELAKLRRKYRAATGFDAEIPTDCNQL